MGVVVALKQIKAQPGVWTGRAQKRAIPSAFRYD
jgi:hypothetical protein